MKWSEGFTRLMLGLFTVATGLSSVFLLSARRAAILGMAVLGDSTAPMRMLCIVLILAGVIGLNLVSDN